MSDNTISDWLILTILFGIPALFCVYWIMLWHRRLSYLDSYQFPDGVRHKLREKYPHLDEEQINQITPALKTYFRLCLSSPRRMVSMPSQAVDAAWHEFILFTKHYEDFCRHAVGRFIHHTPAEAMKTPTDAQDGIRLAWRLACREEGIDPRSPSRLPTLFAIDTSIELHGKQKSRRSL